MIKMQDTKTSMTISGSTKRLVDQCFETRMTYDELTKRMAKLYLIRDQIMDGIKEITKLLIPLAKSVDDPDVLSKFETVSTILVELNKLIIEPPEPPEREKPIVDMSFREVMSEIVRRRELEEEGEQSV